jgi:malonyl-CoA/methylmalonyl-CoA synthetase
VRTLVEAWAWSRDDRILLVLPLHHVHGLINVLTCALWSGATCDMLQKFDASEVWQRIAGCELTLFMAVPTIYSRLIAAWEAADPSERAAMSTGCRRMRLMVSGSAALPVRVLEKWQAISGHRLLERYGMTEIGMALSNPLNGDRRPGFVGVPLAGVDVRLVDGEGRIVEAGTSGEIEVRGPGVFLEYFGLPDQTRDAFREGWFRTGDVGVVGDGCYRIVGRQSVDIIKTQRLQFRARDRGSPARPPGCRRVRRRRDCRRGVGRAGRGSGHRAARRDSGPRLASGVGAAAARRAQDSDAAARRLGAAAERHWQGYEVEGAGAVLVS